MPNRTRERRNRNNNRRRNNKNKMIIHGEALQELQKMESNSVDTIIAKIFNKLLDK